MHRKILLLFAFWQLWACGSQPPTAAVSHQIMWQTDLTNGDLTLLESAAPAAFGDALWLAGQSVQSRRLYNWVARIDSNGRILQQTEWVDSLAVAWISIHPFSGNCLLLSGNLMGDSLCESTTIKTDTQGTVLWRRDWSHVNVHYSKPLSDTAALLLGHTDSDSAGHTDYWVSAIDSAGTAQWSETWGKDTLDESLHQFLAMPSGDFLVLGRIASIKKRKKGDVLLCRLSAQGDILWEKRLGGAENDYLSTIVAAGDGRYFLLGQTTSKGAGKSDVWLVCINDKGDILWEKTYGNQFEDWGAGLAFSADKKRLLIAAKYDNNGEGLSDIWLISTDLEGNVQGENKWNIGNYDASMAILPSPNHQSFWLLATGTPDSTNKAITRLLMVK